MAYGQSTKVTWVKTLCGGHPRMGWSEQWNYLHMLRTLSCVSSRMTYLNLGHVLKTLGYQLQTGMYFLLRAHGVVQDEMFDTSEQAAKSQKTYHVLTHTTHSRKWPTR